MGVKSTIGRRTETWTTGTRPASPNVGRHGYNTTLAQFEFWNGSAWTALAGPLSWTTAGRPASPYPGMDGFNTTDLVREYWNGTNWIQY